MCNKRFIRRIYYNTVAADCRHDEIRSPQGVGRFIVCPDSLNHLGATLRRIIRALQLHVGALFDMIQ